jgi:hypothetical protein
MFLTKDCNDYTLKEVAKEKLTNTYLQKTFNERRRKYREKMLTATRSHSTSLSSARRSMVTPTNNISTASRRVRR